MSEIVVVASFVAQEGKEDEAVAAMQALLEPTHAEDGCILYSLHQGADDPRRIVFVERWESRDHLQRHLGAAHVEDLLGKADDLFSEPGDIVIYEARPGGESKKGSLAAHAAG
jgi:quinol monooxygenase YgiN